VSVYRYGGDVSACAVVGGGGTVWVEWGGGIG
jgi:hypothetical protein